MAFPSLCGNAWCNGSLLGNPLLDISFHEWNSIHDFVRVIVLLEPPIPPPWNEMMKWWVIYGHKVLTCSQMQVSVLRTSSPPEHFFALVLGEGTTAGADESGHISEGPWAFFPRKSLQGFVSTLVLCWLATTYVWVFTVCPGFHPWNLLWPIDYVTTFHLILPLLGAPWKWPCFVWV